MSPSRNRSLDVAKGIGILLVVLGHNWLAMEASRELFEVIFSFHMALFFFLSGVFIKPHVPIKDFVATRADGLLKPYFVVLLLGGVAKFAYSTARGRWDAADAARYFGGVLHGTGRTIAWMPMWFLPHLFLSALTALIVIKVVRTPGRVAMAAAASLALGTRLIASYSFVDDQPWGLDLVPITWAFVAAGWLLREPAMRLRPDLPRLVAALAAFATLHAIWDESIDLNFRRYGHLVVSTAQAGLGIYITLGLAALIERAPAVSEAFARIGGAAIFILIFHNPCQTISTKLVLKATGRPFLAGTVGMVLGIAAPMAIAALVRKSRFLSALLSPIRSAPPSRPAVQADERTASRPTTT